MKLKVKRKRILGYSDPAFTVGLFEHISKEWDERDIVQLFSLMYGADYDEVFNLPDKYSGTIFKYVRFLYENETDITTWPRPEVLTVADEFGNTKELKVPKRVARYSFGQLSMLKSKIRPDTNMDGELISYAAALYFYNQYYNETKIDEDKLSEFQEVIKRLNIMQVYPISFFLLNPQLSFGQILKRRLINIYLFLQALMMGVEENKSQQVQTL